MIEISTAVVLFAFGFFYFRSASSQSKLSHLQWVVISIRTKRDAFEAGGRFNEAITLTELADALSSAAGRLALKVPNDAESSRRASQAIMTVNREDFLEKLGLFSGSLAFLPTRSALYWLADKSSL